MKILSFKDACEATNTAEFKALADKVIQAQKDLDAAYAALNNAYPISDNYYWSLNHAGSVLPYRATTSSED